MLYISFISFGFRERVKRWSCNGETAFTDKYKENTGTGAFYRRVSATHMAFPWNLHIRWLLRKGYLVVHTMHAKDTKWSDVPQILSKRVCRTVSFYVAKGKQSCFAHGIGNVFGHLRMHRFDTATSTDCGVKRQTGVTEAMDADCCFVPSSRYNFCVGVRKCKSLVLLWWRPVFDSIHSPLSCAAADNASIRRTILE